MRGDILSRIRSHPKITPGETVALAKNHNNPAKLSHLMHNSLADGPKPVSQSGAASHPKPVAHRLNPNNSTLIANRRIASTYQHFKALVKQNFEKKSAKPSEVSNDGSPKRLREKLEHESVRVNKSRETHPDV
jgi:hypothetical protein